MVNFKMYLRTVMLACTLLLCLPVSAAAQTGITITPTNIAATIAAGDETREVISVTNSSAGDAEIETHVTEPSAGDDGTRISVTPASVSLGPGESVDVEVLLQVPARAPAGEQGGSIVFDVAGASPSDVTITGSVLVGVDIKVVHPVSDAVITLPRYSGSSDPLTFSMSGRNTGDFTSAVTGRVEIGSLVGEDVAIEEATGIIDNEESFEMQVVWQEPPLIGFRKVTVSLSSGVGAPVTETGYLVILSWKLVLVLAAVGVGLYLLVRKYPAIANVFSRKWRHRNI